MTPGELAELKLLADGRRAHWHAIEMRDGRRTRWLVTFVLACVAVSGVSHLVTDHALGKRIDALEARCLR